MLPTTSFSFAELQGNAFYDERGHVKVIYEDQQHVLKRSYSLPRVFRGMHIQLAPHQQTKLIRVLAGRVIDFVFDPREERPNITWKEICEGRDWIEIPPHLAHGFYALEESVFEYFCIGKYSESHERCYSIKRFLEQRLNIFDPIMSVKDSKAIDVEVRNAPNR